MRGADEIKLLPAYVLFYDSQSAPPADGACRTGAPRSCTGSEPRCLRTPTLKSIARVGTALAYTRFSAADVRSVAGPRPERVAPRRPVPGLLVKRMRALAERAMILRVWQYF